MMNEIKNQMLSYEKNLNKYATFNREAVRFKNIEEDIRPAFFRDTDRIIHSLSYTRYIDKTQVFSFNNNDHLSKRIIHVTLVSKLARTIGRALALNEDLIEAIALGHDLGHVPFGHVGEKILSKISKKYDNTYFNHNVQSVRLLMNVENNGKGSNLTVQVLDGILCHNGEKVFKNYKPNPKTKDEFLAQYERCYVDESEISTLIPMTLEGCVVRLCDIVGYIGRDLEDAIMIGIVSKDSIPSNVAHVLGSTNREIVNTIVLDVISNSYGKGAISMSDEVYDALLELKNFNYEKIYKKANTDEQIANYEKMFEKLFEHYQIDLNNKTGLIYFDFYNLMSDEYKKNTSNNRVIIDYIAGMTDDFFLRQYNDLVDKNNI